MIDRIGALSGKLTIRTQHLHRHLLEALIHLAPEDLLNRTLRPRYSALAHPSRRAHLVQSEDLDFSVHLRKLLSDDGVFACGSAVAVEHLRKLDQALDLALECDLQTGPQGAA